MGEANFPAWCRSFSSDSATLPRVSVLKACCALSNQLAWLGLSRKHQYRCSRRAGPRVMEQTITILLTGMAYVTADLQWNGDRRDDAQA